MCPGTLWVGSADDNMETALMLRAAQRAFADANAKLHHSDRGSQYASEDFRRFLADNQIVQSMSREGNCYDNATGAHKMGRESGCPLGGGHAQDRVL